MLKSDPVPEIHRVLIFSEYIATERYLRYQLEAAGILKSSLIRLILSTPNSRSLPEPVGYSGNLAEWHCLACLYTGVLK